MRLTTEQKKERLKRSVEAWLNAEDCPKKKKREGVFVVARFDAMVRRWFLRSYRVGER